MSLILVCLLGFYSTTSVSFSGEESQLTDVDKIQIVKAVLEERLSNHKVYPLGHSLILSTENIDVELIPTLISGIDLSFLKPDEIKKRDKGNIRYLSFGT